VSNREAMRTKQGSLGLAGGRLDKLRDGDSRMEMSPTTQEDIYEIHPRTDREGFDLVSDRMRYGPIWYAGPDAVRCAIAYAKYRSHACSHRAIIRVFDERGNVTETHTSGVTRAGRFLQSR
jgi:hypothetical protein